MASISIIINSFKHIRRSLSKAKKALIDMRSAIGQRVYEDFVPSHEFVREETAAKLIVELPGYRKEQIKVQIDKYGKLKINGERPLEGNRWSRFRKEFQVPENCNMSEIQAKFENGRLNVLLPKLITEVKGQEQPSEAPQEPKESQRPATEPKPSTGQDDMNRKATVKPNGVAKKQEDEKKGEPVDARKDAQKEGEKEKDQTEEKKYEEKVTGAVKHEEGEKGTDAVLPDVQKKEEVSEPAASGNGRNGERKLKHKLDELGLDFDKQKQIMVNGIVAAVLLFGLGWYLTHKLSPMEEGGH